MKEIILLKLGEIVLKGLNRKNFEDQLLRCVRRRLAKIGQFQVKAAQSTIYVDPQQDDIDMDEAADCVSKIFGVAAYARACVAEKDLEQMKAAAGEYLADTLEGCRTFKVESKRSDKKFPYTSPEISAEIGGYLLEQFPHLTVDVHEPDVTVTVEVRDFGAYIRAGLERGAGGIPVGTGGKACVLISGGIDSPVAAYMMAKRGLDLMAVHFASPPYTSERAEEKVAELLHRVAQYSGRLKMYTVPFTKIQEQIREKCKEDYFTIIMRRFMMEIAERLAVEKGAQALITGESLGQVSSQTLTNLSVIDRVTDTLILRPLIVTDKQDIIDKARDIGTIHFAETMPEYCGVISDRPTVKADVAFVEAEESKIDMSLIEELAEASVWMDIRDIPEDTKEMIGGEVEITDYAASNEVVVDIRAQDEIDAKPLVTDKPHLTIPFFKISSEFANLDQTKTYLLYCEKGVMSKMQAMYLKDQGFQNVKVFRLKEKQHGCCVAGL